MRFWFLQWNIAEFNSIKTCLQCKKFHIILITVLFRPFSAYIHWEHTNNRYLCEKRRCELRAKFSIQSELSLQWKSNRQFNLSWILHKRFFFKMYHKDIEVSWQGTKLAFFMGWYGKYDMPKILIFSIVRETILNLSNFKHICSVFWHLFNNLKQFPYWAVNALEGAIEVYLCACEEMI